MKVCKMDGCERPYYVKGFCNTHYLRNRKYGNPRIKKKEQTIKLDFTINKNGCFVCISHRPSVAGYPQISRNGKESVGHRLVYEEMFGEVPKGMVVRHTCDNRLCINPSHLKIGTYKDNSQDAVKRGRTARGERNAQSKLTFYDVCQIKRIFRMRKVNRRLILLLSKRYRVSLPTLYDIYYEKTWTHVKIS